MHISFADGQKRLKTAVLAAALGLVPGHTALAQTAAVQAQAVKPPVVQPAIDGILAAFKTRPLVGMSDRHGIAQQQDFYAALVRDPRFAREVGNVVVEFGSASHQAIIDRYVAGDDVPYTDLRKVWSDVVGWNPTVTYVGFANVFLSVRAANLGLPPEQRIKVWLGEPPVDWATATKAEVDGAMDKRDSYPADLIVENILKKNKKALVIYGGAHLTSVIPARPRTAPRPGYEAALRNVITGIANGAPDYAAMTPERAAMTRTSLAGLQSYLAPLGALTGMTFKYGSDETGRDTFVLSFANGEQRTFAVSLDAKGLLALFGPAEAQTLRLLVDRSYPGSFFIVWPHSGNGDNRCTEGFESNFRGWPVPALATSVRGSLLDPELRKRDCHIDANDPLWFDGFLYLGPVASLLRAPSLPDLALDPAYRAEISRRQPLRGAQPLSPKVDTDAYVVAPRPWQPAAATQVAGEDERMAAFKANDKDNDGKLDKAAYKALLETLGFADQLEPLFTQRDVNKDGFVSAGEYRTPIQ
jgi:hypothetical protein